MRKSHVILALLVIGAAGATAQAQVAVSDTSIVQYLERPETGGKVKVVQPAELAKRVSRAEGVVKYDGNKGYAQSSGFRIQVFSDNDYRTAKNNALYKEGLIRQAFPDLRQGDYEIVVIKNEQLVCCRSTAEQRVYVALNLAAEEVHLDLPHREPVLQDVLNGGAVFNNDGGRTWLPIPPCGARILVGARIGSRGKAAWRRWAGGHTGPPLRMKLKTPPAATNSDETNRPSPVTICLQISPLLSRRGVLQWRQTVTSFSI